MHHVDQLLSANSWLLAQGQDAGPLITMVIAFAVMGYFMLWRPQKRQQQERETMLQSIKKNDKVVTIGGIYGTVVAVKADADEVTLRTDEATGSKLRMTLSSISKVLSDETPVEKTAK